MERFKLPKCVWLCEDGSGIVQKVEYDPSSNQLIGLVLPLNENTGIPMSFSFMAKSAADIKKYIQKHPTAKLVYIVLAQPLKEKVPPFILQIYGTDNSFTANNVQHRWEHTIQELKK